MSKPFISSAALFLAGCAIASAGCTKTQPDGEGAARVVTFASAISAADVLRVSLTVTGPGINDPISVDLARNGNSWQGIVGHIPVGSDRLFQGRAYDANGAVIYAGEAHAAIVRDTTTVVALTLQELNPPPPFANSAPVIDSIVLSRSVVSPGDTVSAVVTAHDPDGDAIGYAWSASGGAFNTPNAPAVVWTAPLAAATQTLTIQVSDPSGAIATVSVNIQVADAAAAGSAAVNVSVNTWPQVTNVSANPTRIAVGQSTTLSLVALDNDGDALNHQWSASCAGTFDDSTAAQPTFTLGSLPGAGSCALTVSVQDGRGGLGTGAITIATGAVTTNVAPEIDFSLQSAATAGGGEALTFEVSAHDPEGQALTFSWTASSGTLSGQTDSAGGSQVTWTSAACGAAEPAPMISVTIRDAAGGATTRAFGVVSSCASCSDVVRNGLETDIDCGGPACGACAIGRTCTVGSDCASGACSNGTCQPPSCSDGVRNGSETAVDCGGSCGPCADGSACLVNGDCTSGTCSGSICMGGSCADGVQNGAETAVDCGGSCSPCANGATCLVGSDCASAVCTANFCTAASCTDGLRNGTETDVDCGGSGCAPCAIADSCVLASDCVAPPNANAACTGNTCALGACAGGFLSCDMNAANGCETPSTTMNCWACGNACAAGQTCESGTCMNPAWSPVTAVAGTPVSIGIAPNTNGTPFVIYVGTSGNGIYSSPDSVNWTSAGPATIVSVSSQPNSNAAFASLPNGTVQLTQNSGASWAAAAGSPNAVINGWAAIGGVGPLGVSSNAGGSAVVFRGLMGGATWSSSTPFGTGVGTAIALGGGAPPNAIAYAAVNGAGGGIFRSNNIGSATFTFATTNFPQTQVLSVATAPSSLATVFGGTNGQGAGIYRSTDGGASWAPAGAGLGNLVVHAIAVDPTNADLVYAGTGAGVYISQNGGASWTLSGLSSSVVRSLAILNGTPTTIYAVTSSGLFVTTTGGL